MNGLHVYFSTDFNDVNDRDPNVRTIVSDPCFIPGGLELNTWYFWAVDEVNNLADVNVWPGNVWSFLTDDHLGVEDFNSYADTAALTAVWTTGHLTNNGAQVFIETDPALVRSNKSMKFWYLNLKKANKYAGSEAVALASQLNAGTDWTYDGTKALVLYFLGDPCNGLDTTGLDQDQMYVAVEDSGTNAGIVKYDKKYNYDMNAVREDWWHEWDIDLGDPCLSTVDMNSVAKVYIGFGGKKIGQTTDGAGDVWGYEDTVYFDDIEVWPPWCRTEFVPTDFTNDCKTDINDVEVMSAD